MIEELRELDRVAEVERYCLRGRLILERCYSGSLELWRSRHGNKHDSIRRMAERPGCPWRRTTLHNSVAVYALCRRMPFVSRRRGLTASHVVEVLRLSEGDQARFLVRADEQKWSVRQLHEQVVLHRREHGETRGAPRASQLRLLDTRARQCIQSFEELKRMVECAGPMSVEEAQAIQRQLEGVRATLGEILGRIGAPPGE